MMGFINYKVLEYERIDISEGIDVDMANKSKECMLCHNWYFQIRTRATDHIFAMVAII